MSMSNIKYCFAKFVSNIFIAGDTFILVEWNEVNHVDQYRLQWSNDYDGTKHLGQHYYPGRFIFFRFSSFLVPLFDSIR
jgi:hypothetical protein